MTTTITTIDLPLTYRLGAATLPELPAGWRYGAQTTYQHRDAWWLLHAGCVQVLGIERPDVEYDEDEFRADLVEHELIAEESDGDWCVVDSSAQRWWPDAETQAEIRADADPGAKALEICQSSPLRGEWIC